MILFKHLLIIILCYIYLGASGQNLILEESNTANYWGYMNQMNAVESSLRKGILNPNLELAKQFIFSDTLLKRLSSQFNKQIPIDYFAKSGIVIELEKKKNSREGQYTKWIYGTVAGNDIATFVELVVFFEVNMEGEGVKFPKVKKIEIRSPKLDVLDKDKIIEEYNYRKIKAAELPPPPPPIGN